MAIVSRNGRRYVYHSIWENGRATSRYGGKGELAELFEEIDRRDRTLAAFERLTEAAAQAKERQRLEEQDHQAADAFNAVEQVLEALLIAAGFHRPNRGQWRKKRVHRTA